MGLRSSSLGLGHYATLPHDHVQPSCTMKHALIFLSTVAVTMHALAADPGTSPKPDAQDGVWKLVAATLGGAKLPKPALDAITLKVAGANYEVAVRGENVPDQG